jgi:hypothetical protein
MPGLPRLNWPNSWVVDDPYPADQNAEVHLYRILTILETRKFYRKSANLIGHYAKAGTHNYVWMVVENLSLSGIGFRVKGRTTVKTGDLLIIKVALDNKAQTEIVKDIAVRVVRQTDDTFSGGEFCDTRTFYKELAWYLNPNERRVSTCWRLAVLRPDRG